VIKNYLLGDVFISQQKKTPQKNKNKQINQHKKNKKNTTKKQNQKKTPPNKKTNCHVITPIFSSLCNHNRDNS